MKKYMAGASTASFYPMELGKAFDTLLDMDCKVAELFINAEYEMGASFLTEIKKRAEANGVVISSIHPYSSVIEGILLFGTYDRRTEEGMERYKRYLEAAAVVGAKYLVIHGMRRMDLSVRNAGEISDETYFDRMGRLYEIGRNIGAFPVQENVFNHVSSGVYFISNMRKYLGESCAFALDLKQCRLSGVNIDDMMDAMGSRMKHIHISDSSRGKSNLLPGQGVFDFNAFKKQLEHRNYTGKIVAEVYRSSYEEYSEIQDSLRFLDSIFNR